MRIHLKKTLVSGMVGFMFLLVINIMVHNDRDAMEKPGKDDSVHSTHDRQTGRENSPSDGQKVSEDKGKDNISLSRRDVKSVSAFDRQKRRVDSTRDGQVTLDGQKVHILEKKEGDFHDNAAGMSEDAEKVGIIDDRQKVQVLETNSFKELEQLNRSEGSGKRLDPASGRKSGKYPHKKWNFRCSTGDVSQTKFQVDLQERSYQQLEQVFSGTNISSGGVWFPSPVDWCPEGACNMSSLALTPELAIVIPVRDRDGHLRVLLHNLIRFLQRQRKSFRIFVVEQVGEEVFNKAALINVGFKEAQQLGEFNCFIFHDVDLLPTNLCNVYECEAQPRHLAVAVNTLDYKLVYPTLFGGVVSLSSQMMKKINGFSNIFYGWGGEDDESYSRLVTQGFTVQRYRAEVGEYLMQEHDKYAGFPKSERNMSVSHLNAHYLKYDGLSSLHYSLQNISQRALFTHIQVELPSGPRTILESNDYFTCKQHLFERFTIRDAKVARLMLKLKEPELTIQRARAFLVNLQSAKKSVVEDSCEKTMLYNREHGISRDVDLELAQLALDSSRMGVNVIKATPRPPGGQRKVKRQIQRKKKA